MAEIYPFRALRYQQSQVSLQDVLTQPYDKITPAMQQEYYRRSPFNLIRVELGKEEPADAPGDDRYSRAAQFLHELRAKGILSQDSEPSIYAYEQHFQMPGEPGRMRVRRGFIALLRLVDYSEGVVFRHEHTLSKPKSDRLNLLTATRTLTGQIFMLYSDPQKQIDDLIWGAVGGKAPTSSVHDEYGVQHKLWKISDPEILDSVRELMSTKKLIIADGHHRYETSLTYREMRRKQAPSDASSQLAPYELLMSTFVNTEAEGLVILPTHRVVSGLKDFRTSEMLDRAREYFVAEPLENGIGGKEVLRRLSESAGKDVVMAACTPGGSYLLRSRADKIDQALAHLPPEQRSLDVVQLHELLLQKVIGITPEQVREQSHVSYFRDADEAVGRLKEGANVAFLINPVSMEQLKQVAFAGQVMPQKSTDFYPKLLSGITIYAME
jgi:uncharacterized protein (DUF1015 family)